MHLLFATVYARLSSDRRQTGAIMEISGVWEAPKARKMAVRGKFPLTARARTPIMERLTGCSAAGSALGSGPRGRGFKSPHSDHKRGKPATLVVAGFPCSYAGLRVFQKHHLPQSRSKKRRSNSKIIGNFRHEIRHEKPVPPPCPYAKKECRPVGGIPFFQHSFCAIFFYRWYFCWYSS